SELFAVFDADFVPPPDILTRMVPHFEPGVGMVQARWEHLNRDTSLLTRVQAIYLDAHFAIESAARNFSGRFFNFNGTAGIWRREAIEEAGGWSSSTLTEDLDLSYRAQLAGWRFVFLPEITVPAELPDAISGFQEQQYRWAKGSIQTARKILPRIFHGGLPATTKSEAFFHLTNNACYLLTFILSLLIVPAIVIRQRLGLGWTLLGDLLMFAASTASVVLFYIDGQRFAGRPRPGVRELLCVLPIGIGLSLRNATAVLEGLFERGGHFRRTPKRGATAGPIADRAPRLPWGELLMAAFFLAACSVLLAARQWVSIPFLWLFLGGFGYVAAHGVGERYKYCDVNQLADGVAGAGLAK
ncbi:MAG TPA: glycosyltransferase family 2 protein, partial [Thermoanaerobaculia bacterium]|nr:glycosyltransferase family 2 protein [Thermoanaerobaculia bacterium]